MAKFLPENPGFPHLLTLELEELYEELKLFGQERAHAGAPIWIDGHRCQVLGTSVNVGSNLILITIDIHQFLAESIQKGEEKAS